MGAVGGAVALHLRLVLDVRRRIAQERILERVPARHHALSEIFGEESGIEQVICGEALSAKVDLNLTTIT